MQPNIPVQNEDFNLKKKYGLQKIETLLIQKNSGNDMAMFNIGVDLTNLGLNLNDSSEIYSKFGSPFADNPTKKVDSTNFNIPQCYSKTNVNLDKKHFKKFPDETLFYVFYNYQEDAYRFMATEELYSRNWKYHYPTETWVQIDATNKSSGSGSCKYFNVSNWESVITNQIDFNNDEFLSIADFKNQVNVS